MADRIKEHFVLLFEDNKCVKLERCPFNLLDSSSSKLLLKYQSCDLQKGPQKVSISPEISLLLCYFFV